MSDPINDILSVCLKYEHIPLVARAIEFIRSQREGEVDAAAPAAPQLEAKAAPTVQHEVRAAAPVVQPVPPEAKAAAPVVQLEAKAAAPVVQLEAKAAAPVVRPALPEAKAAAPVVQPAPPEAKAAAPVVQPAPPEAKAAAPVVQPAPPEVKAAAPVVQPAQLEAKAVAPPEAEAAAPVVRPEAKAAAPVLPRESKAALALLEAKASAPVAEESRKRKRSVREMNRNDSDGDADMEVADDSRDETWEPKPKRARRQSGKTITTRKHVDDIRVLLLSLGGYETVDQVRDEYKRLSEMKQEDLIKECLRSEDARDHMKDLVIVDSDCLDELKKYVGKKQGNRGWITKAELISAMSTEDELAKLVAWCYAKEGGNRWELLEEKLFSEKPRCNYADWHVETRPHLEDIVNIIKTLQSPHD